MCSLLIHKALQPEKPVLAKNGVHNDQPLLVSNLVLLPNSENTTESLLVEGASFFFSPANLTRSMFSCRTSEYYKHRRDKQPTL